MKVLISPDAQAKINVYVNECPKEISGLGLVEERKDGTFYISEIFLLEQEVSGTETDIEASAIAKLILEIGVEKAQKLRFWWHSHVNMGVFWSGTDHSCVEQLVSNATSPIISIVYNKKGESLCRVDGWWCRKRITEDKVYHEVDWPQYNDVVKGWAMDNAKEDVEVNGLAPDEAALNAIEYYEAHSYNLAPLEEFYKKQCLLEMASKVKEKQIITYTYATPQTKGKKHGKRSKVPTTVVHHQQPSFEEYEDLPYWSRWDR